MYVCGGEESCVGVCQCSGLFRGVRSLGVPCGMRPILFRSMDDSLVLWLVQQRRGGSEHLPGFFLPARDTRRRPTYQIVPYINTHL